MQRGIEFLQLRGNGSCIASRIGVRIKGCHIDDVQEQPRTREVPKELVPQARTFGCSFDEPRDVGDHEAAIDPGTNHSEMRMQGGKRVVGNLGAGSRDGANEGGFSGIGKSQQSNIGKHFQLEPEGPMLAGLTGSRSSGRAVGARFEIDIAEAPLASPREQCDLLVRGQVGDRFSGFRVRDHGTGGHAQYDVIGTFPAALGTAPVLAVPRVVNAREAIFDEGIDVSVGHRIDAAAAAAVPAVGPSARYVLFAPEAHDAVAPLAGVDLDARFVDEFHGACGNKKALPRG